MVTVYGLYISVITLPFVLAMLGFRSSEKSVLIGMTIAILTFFIWQLKLFGITSNLESAAAAIIANTVFLFGSHYLLQQPGGWVGIKDKCSFNGEKKVYI